MVDEKGLPKSFSFEFISRPSFLKNPLTIIVIGCDVEKIFFKKSGEEFVDHDFGAKLLMTHLL